ncbi:hypothetical protein A3B32_01125 [Candidatus Uhrbacteria bacterium RIFCSPLOWO2_01_FULL_53_9]|uniref:Magnesium transporter CorA n=2 Tax=Candidatus Uhriibacteriota TaxID=1752732 RepID=A0A1F7UYE9_9BACT|nr:MAG: hypothetical protein A3C17_02315 [Candidatus Uhrbacteria bacterium RIFCSPHIGHO2_02_FULL_53_13]OGL83295.1 MAG: hypothetical protein A3B32_01125 [Candidatus Uhrbacteria bacterium RIFCSPLOWO2_01_FULL_53_9]
MSYPTIKHGRVEWINLDRARKRDLEKIADTFDISNEHRRALFTRDHRSHVHESERYTLVCLVHPSYDQTTNDVQARELDVILTKQVIVTIHHGHLLPISAHFKQAQSDTALSCPIVIFGKLLHVLLTDAADTLDHIASNIDAFEQRLFKPNGHGGLETILHIQTNIIDTKKLLENQLYIVERLLMTQTARMRESFALQFREIRNHQEELAHIIDTDLQAAQTLHHVLDASIIERTNKLIRALTVMTLVMLPASLLSGIFGMNTNHPWILGVRYDFAIIIGLMMLTGVIILLLIRSKKL